MPRENLIKTEGTEKRKDGEVLEEMERSRDQELGVPFPHMRMEATTWSSSIDSLTIQPLGSFLAQAPSAGISERRAWL